MPREFETSAPGFQAAFDAFLAEERAPEEDLAARVRDIVAAVRSRGDSALIDYTERFDRLTVTPETLRVPEAELEAAAAACAPETLEALRFAAARIEAYHAKQKPADALWTDDLGVRLGHRWTAVAAAGVYVPGGKAAYPSSVLMNLIPAKVAGVPRVAMVVPTPDGKTAPLVLAAAQLAGVDEVYRVGGAQAIAALAYGTETIRPVDKIVGPGNAYVAEAKRQVFGQVGIDSIAGPSEILVVADAENDPAWIAADLLSQAEHDSVAQSILITDDGRFAEAVQRAVEVHLQRLPRSEIASESWERYGAILLVKDLAAETPGLVDAIAPEHLELAVADPEALLPRIRNAGSIFLGRHTPEVLGDYLAGPNHVLPTARSARFASGLSTLDFMKRSSLLGADAQALEALGPAAIALAEAEGLQAHALSVAIRLRNRAAE